MAIQLGVIMDSIASINPQHDSTFAITLEAQQRDWSIFYFQQKDIFVKANIVYAHTKTLRLIDNDKHWFEVIDQKTIELHALDVILMRKDPPIDNAYLYTTQLLDLVAQRGTLVINKPQSLRDFNEKLFIQLFPQCIAPTLITTDAKQIHAFLLEQQDIICKPLDGMGGRSIFRVQKNDPNLNVIVETLTQNGTQQMMAQRFIPEISAGDKRILLIDGQPVPHGLARLAKTGETRANMAVGGRVVGAELTKRDHWICEQIGPVLRDKGILFAGIDVIGDYLTEINITSPTCIRELDKIFSLNISAQLLDCVLNYKMR
jgi:glutathione synthase